MTQSAGIALLAGLGNPGAAYADTRHNAGFWLLAALQEKYQFSLAPEKKFNAQLGQFTLNGKSVRVVAPTTFVNLSGQCLAPLASFYRIAVEHILVVHDELDLAVGTLRLKLGGGHGGHNGLRDLSTRLGSNHFARLRIGIGHPGHAAAVTNYVLGKPSPAARNQIDAAIAAAIATLPDIVAGNFAAAMQRLHGFEF